MTTIEDLVVGAIFQDSIDNCVRVITAVINHDDGDRSGVEVEYSLYQKRESEFFHKGNHSTYSTGFILRYAHATGHMFINEKGNPEYLLI